MPKAAVQTFILFNYGSHGSSMCLVFQTVCRDVPIKVFLDKSDFPIIVKLRPAIQFASLLILFS